MQKQAKTRNDQQNETPLFKRGFTVFEGVRIQGLKDRVLVRRDENGMAYIHANNTADAIMAQGFVTAQDRLFQMQVTRLFIQGRVCELAGPVAKNLGIKNPMAQYLSPIMAADFSDNDKILAVLPGGVTCITFHPNQKDQVEAFMSGDKKYWWFSDQAIDAHETARMTLTP